METHHDAGIGGDAGATIPVAGGAGPALLPVPDPAWIAAVVRCNPRRVVGLVSQCRAVVMSLASRCDTAPAAGSSVGDRPAVEPSADEAGVVDPVATGVSAAMAAAAQVQVEAARWRREHRCPSGPRSSLSRSEQDRADRLAGELASDPQVGATLDAALALADSAETQARGQGRALLDAVEVLERVQRACEAAKTVLGQRYVEVRHHQWRAAVAAEDAAAAVHGRSQVPESWASASKSATGELAFAAMVSYSAGQHRRVRDRVVLADLPHTLAALARGDICDQAVREVYGHVKDLSCEDRAGVDADLAGLYPQPLSVSRLANQAQAAALARDPEGALARQVAAVCERRVTTRLGRDGLARVTAALPIPDAAAVTAALDRVADQARGDGLDQRSRQQVRADTLVEATTGTRATAHHDDPPPQPAPPPESTSEPVSEPAPGDETVDSARATAHHDDPAPQPAPPPEPAPNDETTDGARTARHPSPGGEPAPARGGDPVPDSGPISEATAAASAAATDRQPDSDVDGAHDTDDVDSETAAEAASPPGDTVTRPAAAGVCPACHAFWPPTQRPAIELQLIITDHALFAAFDDTSPAAATPARLNGQPIPPDIARRLVTDPDTLVALRRLYLHPTSKQLVAMDSRRRTFDGLLRAFIHTRDQTCRAPFSAAPIRHLDHANPHRNHGPTTAANGTGLSAAANYLKETRGITVTPVPDPETGDTTIAPAMRWTMPSGRQYTTRAPRLIP